MRKLIFFSCFFLFVFYSCNEPAETKSPAQQKLTIKPATIQLKNLTGGVIDMQQYKGKVLFVNFWATWCKPCLEEMPSIATVISKMKGKPVEFLLASDEGIDQIADFKSAHAYAFDYFQAQNMAQLNVTTLPTTFIFDKNGTLVFNQMGTINWNDKESLDLLLNLTK